MPVIIKSVSTRICGLLVVLAGAVPVMAGVPAIDEFSSLTNTFLEWATDDALNHAPGDYEIRPGIEIPYLMIPGAFADNMSVSDSDMEPDIVIYAWRMNNTPYTNNAERDRSESIKPYAQASMKDESRDINMVHEPDVLVPHLVASADVREDKPETTRNSRAFGGFMGRYSSPVLANACKDRQG